MSRLLALVGACWRLKGVSVVVESIPRLLFDFPSGCNAEQLVVACNNAVACVPMVERLETLGTGNNETTVTNPLQGLTNY
jgi:hypothetical protein